MAKYFTLIICFLFPTLLLVAEEVQVEIGNTEAVLDVIQGNTETTLELIYNAKDTEVEVLQGDTIKIIQGAQEVVVEVAEGDKDALIEAIEEKPDIHYFIKSESEGLSIIEIWGKPDIAELEQNGYIKVTKDDIHSQGYLTPSESEEEAEKNGDIHKGNDRQYGYSSWINTGYSGNNKRIEAGSSTTRSWYCPGSLALSCTLRKWVPGFGYFPTNWHPPEGGWYTTWGWRTSATFIHTYPSFQTYAWMQRGHHHWGNINDRRTSQVIRTY